MESKKKKIEPLITQEARRHIVPQVMSRPEGSVTIDELMEALGVGQTTVKHFLKRMRAEGKLRETRMRCYRNGAWSSIKLFWIE